MNLLLPLLVVFPACIGIALLILRRQGMADDVGERIGLASAVLLLVISLIVVKAPRADIQGTDRTCIITPSIEFSPSWMRLTLPSVLATGSEGWQLSLGLDGIGAMMVVLTTLVTAAVLLIACSTVTHERSDFAAWTLLAASGMLLVFTSMDLILFYIGFELTLIPLFAMISCWGDKGADVAARRFVLYTLAGSLPMILGLLGIVQLYAGSEGWTVSLPELSQRTAQDASDWRRLTGQIWIFVFLVLGLGIKMALLPFHTWLPNTYGKSHATCGAFLAAVVLKLGLFGFVRLALPLVPLACERYGPSIMSVLGALAIVVGALMALAQTDLRRLLAYSSLSHVGFVTLGLFALNEEGITGAVLQMFNHGITTAAVFLVVACMIARRGTAQLDIGNFGLATRFPKLAAFMIFFLAAGAGVPGLNNFVGEMLTLTATIARTPWVAAIGVLGIVLGAWYAFRLIQNLLFGIEQSFRFHEKTLQMNSQDAGMSEKIVFSVFASLCLIIGIYPQRTIDIFRDDTQQLSQNCDVAMNSRLSVSPTRTDP